MTNLECRHHVNLTLAQSTSYCFALSGAFVGCLYVAPKKIRALSRDDARQIRWRTFTTSMICTLSVASYPLLFCDNEREEEVNFQLPAFLDVRRDVRAVAGAVTHVALLYLGPILETGSNIYVALKRDGCLTFSNFVKFWYNVHIDPILRSLFVTSATTSSDRWVRLRNLIVAPFAEELVFRKLMAPALYATGMSVGRVALVAPLFFGVAHAHHAILSLRNGDKRSKVLARTIFQFTYTSLFGSYATYAFLRTGSILAVTTCHSFCNSMGLPSLSFARSGSPLHRYRRLLWSAHFAGVVLFIWEFQSGLLLPRFGGCMLVSPLGE